MNFSINLKSILVLLLVLLVNTAPAHADDHLVITAPDVTADKDDVVSLEAQIKGGKAPYHVSWYEYKDFLLNNEFYGEPDCMAHILVAADRCKDYVINVIDSEGALASTVQRLIVRNTEKVANFEDVYLYEETYDNGRYLYSDDAPEKGWYNSFLSGSFVFSSLSYTLGTENVGSTCNNLSQDESEDYSSDFISVTKSGYNGSHNYITVCDSAYISFADKNTDKRNIEGFYVTCSLAAYNSAMQGSDLSPEFSTGDYMYITITDTGSGRSTDFYLADYRSEDTSEHYCLDTWQWVDLRPLKNIEGDILIVVEGTRVQHFGQCGLSMPAKICIDEFDGKYRVTDVDPIDICESLTVDLKDILPVPDNAAEIRYSLYDIEGSYANEATFEIDGSVLKVNKLQSDVRFIIKVESKGKSEFYRIPIIDTTVIQSVSEVAIPVEYFTIEGLIIDSHNISKGLRLVRYSDGTIKKVFFK